MPLINPDTLDLHEQVVRTNKVQKTHKGGRTMSWNVLIVVGDGNGHVGAGVGKARAIPDAIRKGVEAAKKNLVKVPMVGSTIPHEVLSRVSAAEVLLRPASPGTGVVAGGSVRAILEAAGVRDVLAKSLGSNNPINGAWATLHALRSLKRAKEVARLRGKEVLDLVSKQVAALSGEEIGYVPSAEATVVSEPEPIAEPEAAAVAVSVETPAEPAAPEAVVAAPAESEPAAEPVAEALAVEPVASDAPAAVDETAAKPKRAPRKANTTNA
jgi:small subunit ribosomal protein S5